MVASVIPNTIHQPLWNFFSRGTLVYINSNAFPRKLNQYFNFTVIGHIKVRKFRVFTYIILYINEFIIRTFQALFGKWTFYEILQSRWCLKNQPSFWFSVEYQYLRTKSWLGISEAMWKRQKRKTFLKAGNQKYFFGASKA